MGRYKDEKGHSRATEFLKGLGDVAKPILKTAGGLTGIDALSAIGDAITTSKELKAEEKAEALRLINIEMSEISKRWDSDNKADSWLAKNIRPLLIGYAMFVTSLFCVLDSTKSILVKEHWVDLFGGLLLTMVVAYFGSRGAEKILKR